MRGVRHAPALLAASICAALAACASAPANVTDAQLQSKVQTIVVIFAENRSFDNIYGLFPGANGIPGLNPAGAGAIAPQTDRNAANTVLPKLPKTWKGVTAAGQQPVIREEQTGNLPNQPFAIESGYGTPLSLSTITRDLVHRYYENQMQINGGANDKFAAYGDSGGLVMGYHDGRPMAMWKIAQQYVLADNFFMGAFGGSFLNHQYLICGCAPEYRDADKAAAQPTISELETDGSGRYLPRLKQAANSPASALDGPPVFVRSGNLTPRNYLGDGTFRAVNTMQPAFQPSGNPPASAKAADLPYADPSKGTTLPAQIEATIGDRLSAKNVSWAWYTGAWRAAIADGARDPAAKRQAIYEPRIGAPNLQAHHQPFNYYARFDPVAHASDRAAHLKDYDDLLADAAAGKLPQVVFYKPQGNLNQHAGYASMQAGDEHVADLIARLQASPQWAHMVIAITYDENGGIWDHVAPSKADLLGPGTRIPAIIVSPFAKRGFIDHTPYDTGSVMRLMNRRFGLEPLPGIQGRDDALKANGNAPMGDLTNALQM
jgi:acid phosphatase